MSSENAASKRLATTQDYALRRKELDAQGNKVITRPIPRIDKDILKQNRGGRKKKYTPTRMKNEINRYFEHCETNDLVPSIKGMMIFLKMYKDMFYTYLKYPEFTDLLEHARMIISDWAEADVYNTPGQAAGKIAYMKNLQGWSDKLETKNESEVRTISSVEEARLTIKTLAPQLLELLKSEQVSGQIANETIEEAEIVEEKVNAKT